MLSVAVDNDRRNPHDNERGTLQMNKDIISGKWTQIKGKAQAKWGDLTDDVFDVAEGNSEYLAGKLQEQYGWERERAEQEVKDFEKTLH
jgi:uncharacterized protein YjbJ (UPF0337 family)